jgi:hypothetical protein
VTRRARPAHDLARALGEGAVAENGGSVFVYSSDPRLVSAIRSFDYVGPLFTADGRDGTFPLSLVGLAGPRAPDAVFSFAWSADVVNGIVGTATGTESKMVMDHGSISPYDLHNTLVVQGPGFRSGWRSPVPVGNIDICPTLVRVLGLPDGSSMDGRVVSEALSGWTGPAPEWTTLTDEKSFAARGRDWRQVIWFDRVGDFQYLTGGTVDSR